MRRILIIVLALVLIAAIAFGVWYLFFRGGGSGGAGGPDDPFGGIDGGNANGGTEPLPDVNVPVDGAGEEVAPRLLRITDGPVALGVAVFPVAASADASSSPARDTEVRYVDRATGNLYRYVFGERTLERLTNRTLPGIQEASWARDGSRAYLRFLTNEGAGGMRIETYMLPADGSEGALLPSGLSDVIVGSSTVLSVLPSTTGAIGTRTDLLGANPSTAFSTALSSLRFTPAGQGYAGTTRASAGLSGFSFYISPKGEFTRLLGPLAGLTVLPSPSGGRYLYSSVSGSTLRLDLLEVTPPGTTALPVATVADKCVWGGNEQTVYCAVPRAAEGSWPDDWYQGEVSTSDRIWKIDLTSRLASLVFDPLLIAETDIDAVALTLDAAADVLVFTNKRDGSLWLYDL